MNRDKIREAGKYVGVGVLGAAVAGAGITAFNQNQSADDNKVQELQDELEDSEQTVEDLNDRVDSLEERPTQEEYVELRDQVSSMFTQEEVNEMTAREDVLEFLPVFADEDVEIHRLDNHATDATEDDNAIWVPVDEEDADFAGFTEVSDAEIEEEYDEVRATYKHDDGHIYIANAVEFEDSEDADEFEEEVRDIADDEDFDETVGEDAYIHREGNTVVYVYGNSETDDYESYNFDAVTQQYEG